MKIIAIVLLVLLSPSAYGSKPILEGDALACIRGGSPSEAAAVHTILFSNGEQVDVLRPGVLGAWAVLDAKMAHSATFKVDGFTTQTIAFSFKDFPGRDVCFRYDSTKNVWSVGETPPDLCRSCSLNADGT